jgi:ribosomal protein L37AE/L43A
VASKDICPVNGTHTWWEKGAGVKVCTDCGARVAITAQTVTRSMMSDAHKGMAADADGEKLSK